MNRQEEIRKRITATDVDGEPPEKDGKFIEGYECFEYIKTIQSAMHAWTECNPNRAFILLAMGECDEDGKDTRNVSASLGGSPFELASILAGVMKHNANFRHALELAIKMLQEGS